MLRLHSSQNNKMITVSECVNESDYLGVSVHILSFNHEKTLSRCIQSILMQKVDFDVEILIHDDCSNDNSLPICLEYKKKYPNVIHVISETNNLYSQTNGVLEIEKKLTTLSKGTYIAICEGDDYWIDGFKLFYQYHAMKDNQNICFCVHKVLVKNLFDGSRSFYPLKNYSSKIISSKKFIDIINKNYSFQTSSYFIRKKECLEFYNNIPNFALYMPTNDESWLLFFGSRSDVIYINKAMSCYNKMYTDSWSSKASMYTTSKRTNDRESVIKSICEFNTFTNLRYKKSCERRIAYNVMMNLINENNFKEIFKKKEISIELFKYDIKMYIKKWIKSYVFKK